MYDPPIRIEKGVYPYLVKWCLSIGYELNTNEPHTLLYRITCYDHIRVKELAGEGKDNAYTREEAESLVNDLSKCFQDGKESFTPDYDPPIHIHDDFSVDVFLPALELYGEYEVKWEQWGIYHKITKVTRRAKATGKPGGLYIGSVLDRNDVLSLIRGLEYDAVMPPFIVGYNLLRDRGSMSIAWASQKIENYEAAQEYMNWEKERHVTADWRIYTQVTDIASEQDSLSLDYVRCEGWLWLRVHHPKKDACGADYAEEGFYNDLRELRTDILQIQEVDIYAIIAIYACVHHDPLPEPEPEAEDQVTPEQMKLLEDSLSLNKERLTLLEMIQGELGNDVALYLKALDQIVNTKTDRGAESYYFGDQWVRGCRSGMAIALDILTLKIEDVTISPNLVEIPIRIRYYEHVQERHILNEIIISEEEDHGSGEDQ